MSEFIAEAQVLIRPDTTGFRTQLEAQVAAATRRPLTVPVVPVSLAPRGGQDTAANAERGTAAAIRQRSEEERRGAEETKKATKATRDFTSASHAARQGAIAQSAALAGLRGSVIGANSAFIAGVAGVLAFGRAVQSAAELETQLNVFRVTAGATADEMERVGDTAKDLGRDLTLPGVTAADAAQTFLQLARAGLTVEDSLEGARGVLQLAVAAELSFADAAQITASALNAFALSGDEAVNVADLLTNAANASQASIGDMGIALRQSAAIADLAGFSLSETATFLTQLAQAGLAGSDAGTSFRVAIQRLIAPSAAARKELGLLKVNLRDAVGNLRPEAFFELGTALERMGRAQADAARQTIFGNDASRAAAFFARINAQAFREQEKALQRSGSAAEVAGARNAGFAGSVENLKNQLSGLGIEVGELALPPLGAAANAAAGFFGLLADSIRDTKESMSFFSDDLAKLKVFFGEAEDSGRDFLGFMDRTDEAVSDVVDQVDRLLGIPDPFRIFKEGTEAADPPVRQLRKSENELAVEVTEANRRLSAQAAALDAVAAQADVASSAISRLQGQEAGLAEQVTRARIADDEGAELDALRRNREVLQKELEAQEAIISAPGRIGDATARQAIRNRILPQLEAVNNEISNIIEGQRIENENLARDAANAASERDRALLDALSGRRDDAERRISIAGDREGLADDIRAQNSLQALIKQQIEKVRARIGDEKVRTAAIRELRLALQASRREEAALRQEQRNAIAEQRADAISQRSQGLELDIELADINENDKRRVALRRRRIAQLKREAKLLHLEGNALKENRNERARIRKEIEAILEEDKKTEETTSKGSAQQFFEFLQTQQGFASSLLGNLFPAAAAQGTVGGSTPVPDPGAQIRAQAAAKSAGPTFGQAATEVDLLREMLRVLRAIQGGNAHPEAQRQRLVQNAVMDTMQMGGV